MGHTYTPRELRESGRLDGKVASEFSGVSNAILKGKIAAETLIELNKGPNSPVKEYVKSQKESRDSAQIVLAALISVNAYRGVLESLGLNYNSQQKEIFFDEQIVLMAKTYHVDYNLLKKIFLFSEKMSTGSMYPNTQNFDKLLREFDSTMGKQDLANSLDKIVNATGFKNNINFENQDVKIRKKKDFKIQTQKIEIALPIFGQEINHNLLLKMLDKKNVWFNSGLPGKMKIDVFYYASRFIFVVLGLAICKTILSTNGDYKELIIEKLNKTNCFMGGKSGLHDGNLLGDLSSNATKFGERIKLESTSSVLNDYIELYKMFKELDLNVDADTLLFKNIKVLFSKIDDKSVLSLNKLIGIDEDYLYDIAKSKKGIHIFTIFEYITNKMSDIKDTSMNNINLLEVYEFIYNMDPNKLLFYAESQLKKSTAPT